MIDKSAVLTTIFQRNAWRRAAQLPLLDVRRELDRRLDEAQDADYAKALMAVIEEVRERLHRKWHRRHYTPGNSIEAWPRNAHVIKVAERVLRMRTGLTRPFYQARA
jgi:hypothetical protein